MQGFDRLSSLTTCWNPGLEIFGVKYKEKIYIGDSKGIRAHIMEALHASAFGGHSGQLGSTQRIGSIFYWPLMKQDIVKYVQHRYILGCNSYRI